VAKQKTVLIIDDEFDICQTMKSLLENEGYITKIATNGAQALDCIKNNEKFDLITLDVQMPTLSGYDVLRLLREKINHKSKMVYVSIVPKQEVDMTDADGFVQKPFDRQTYLKVIKKVLGDETK